jgi:hypothetical protein
MREFFGDKRKRLLNIHISLYIQKLCKLRNPESDVKNPESDRRELAGMEGARRNIYFNTIYISHLQSDDRQD